MSEVEITTPTIQYKSNLHPNLKDLLDLFKRDVMISMNCHALATIVSYNPDANTIVARMNYCKTLFKPNQSGQFVPKLVQYPLIVDAPLITLGGLGGVGISNGTGISFPINPGDQCLIFFNDRNMDTWFSTREGTSIGTPSASTGPVNTARLHHFSDALAMVWNVTNPGYDALRAVFYYGNSGVAVRNTHVKIFNASTTLGITLSALLTALQTFNTAIESAIDPVVANAATALAPALVTAINDISGLLE
jgi:hypothetical protein